MFLCFNSRAFTLIEVLVSIFIVGGVLTVMYSGFDLSKQLQTTANFNTEAAYLAEREMEYIKSELISGSKKYTSRLIPTSFKLNNGWKVFTSLTKTEFKNEIKITVCANKNNDRALLTSYIYIPNETKNESNDEIKK